MPTRSEVISSEVVVSTYGHTHTRPITVSGPRNNNLNKSWHRDDRHDIVLYQQFEDNTPIYYSHWLYVQPSFNISLGFID